MIWTNSRGADKYRSALKRQGVNCIDSPLIKITVNKSIRIEKALKEDVNILCFTSINGIRFFFEECLKKFKTEQFKAQIKKKDIWVVGTESKKEMKKWVDKKVFVPQRQSALDLVSAIKKHYKCKEKIALIQGERADDDLKIQLIEAGQEVNRINVYKTESVKNIPLSIKNKMENGVLVYLSSPSAVESLINIINFSTSSKHQFLAIGNTTAKKMLSYKIKPTIILASPDYKNTLTEIKKYFDGMIE